MNNKFWKPNCFIFIFVFFQPINFSKLIWCELFNKTLSRKYLFNWFYIFLVNIFQYKLIGLPFWLVVLFLLTVCTHPIDIDTWYPICPQTTITIYYFIIHVHASLSAPRFFSRYIVYTRIIIYIYVMCIKKRIIFALSINLAKITPISSSQVQWPN